MTNDDAVLDVLRGNARVGNDLEGTWARPGSLSAIPVGASDIANVLSDFQKIAGNDNIKILRIRQSLAQRPMLEVQA